jgi:predicted nucleic acid-binding protein
MPNVFIDTNVLIYMSDAGSPTKADRADQWVKALAKANRAIISPQVVNEYVAVSLKRFRSTPRADIYARARTLIPWCRAPLDGATSLSAMSLLDRYALSWWDALIVASAAASGCLHVLSEDMKTHARFGTVTVVDPFTTAPAALLNS